MSILATGRDELIYA